MQNPDFIPLTFNPRAAAAAAVKKKQAKKPVHQPFHFIFVNLTSQFVLFICINFFFKPSKF